MLSMLCLLSAQQCHEYLPLVTPFCRCKKSSTQRFSALFLITQQVAKLRHPDLQSLVKEVGDFSVFLDVILFFLLVFFLWWPLSVLASSIHPFLTWKINKVLSFLFCYQCQDSWVRSWQWWQWFNQQVQWQEETCRLKSSVAFAAPWGIWTNRESIWLFTEAACPVMWYYSEYAGSLISFEEKYLIPRKFHRKPILLPILFLW